MMTSMLQRFWVWCLRFQGLNISSDCRLMDFPSVGSEPYLISIGRHVTISSEVMFINHDGGTWLFREQPDYRNVIKFGRIIIHDNCFIGARVIIMPGVAIGPNAIVAAGAVVTKSVPPDTVVAGVPAHILCSVTEYAERARQSTPQYDLMAYGKDKKNELLRVLPVPVVGTSQEGNQHAFRKRGGAI